MRAVHIVIFPASIFKSASARSNAVTGLMDFIVVKQGLLFRVLFLCSEEHPEIKHLWLDTIRRHTRFIDRVALREIRDNLRADKPDPLKNRTVGLACARSRRSGSSWRCAITVQKPYLFDRLGLALSEKQMPRFVGNSDS